MIDPIRSQSDQTIDHSACTKIFFFKKLQDKQLDKAPKTHNDKESEDLPVMLLQIQFLRKKQISVSKKRISGSKSIEMSEDNI